MYNDNNSGSEAFAQDSWAICCYVFLVSLLCEGIKVSNGVLMVSKPKQRYFNCTYVINFDPQPPPPNSNTDLYILFQLERTRMNTFRMLSWNHFIATGFHFIRMALAYLLMLIVMTFNIWLIMSIILGSVLGYFIIGGKKPYSIDISDHCH